MSTDDDFRLAGWRDAWEVHGGEARPTHEFRLSTAWTAAVRFNLAGWVIRGLLLIGIVLTAAKAAAPPLLIWTLPFLGWVLAGLDLFGEHIGDRWTTGLKGRLASHLENGRGTAAANAPAILENGGALAFGMIFVGPLSLDLTGSAEIAGLLMLTAFASVLVAQIVTDAGYYNFSPEKPTDPLVTAFRWVAIPVYAVSGAALCLAALPQPKDKWAAALALSLFGSAVVAAATHANAHRAASLTWVTESRRQQRDVSAALAGEVHRIGVQLTQRAVITDNADVALPMRWAFAELDDLRVRAQAHRLAEPTRLAELVDLLSRKDMLPTNVKITLDSPDLTLCITGSTVLRQVVLDLAANAVAAGATRTDIRVTVTPQVHPIARVEVAVTDNGPGLSDAELTPAPGSSRWAISSLCRSRGGALTYARRDDLTEARAVFHTDIRRAGEKETK